MTYEDLALTDHQMLEVFAVARETGALVMVHAENYDAIRFLTDAARSGAARPRRSITARRGRSRSSARRRIAPSSLAEMIDVPIMIVHVSNGEAMEQIRWAQGKGLKVFGETCPQYLVLTEKDLDGLNMEGAKYVCSPPPRDEAIAAGRAGAASRPACSRCSRPTTARSATTIPQGKLNAEGPHQLPLGAERHSRRRDAAADPVLGGRGQGPHHAQPVRGAVVDQPRQDVRPVSAQGHDRRRLGRRHRDLGPGAQGHDHGQATCTTARTTRPTRASR